MHYLRQVRLDRTRENLAQAHGSVADIAYNWGFTNLSRFAVPTGDISGLKRHPRGLGVKRRCQIEGAPRRVSIHPPPTRSRALLIGAALSPTRQPEFSGLLGGFFLLLEDQPADLEVQLLGVGEVIDVAQRLILAR